MEKKEHAHCDAHFQDELDSLKASVGSLTSLLEQVLRNTSSESPSTRPAVTAQTQGMNHHEEVIGERVHDLQQNQAFIQSAALTPAPTPTL